MELTIPGSDSILFYAEENGVAKIVVCPSKEDG